MPMCAGRRCGRWRRGAARIDLVGPVARLTFPLICLPAFGGAAYRPDCCTAKAKLLNVNDPAPETIPVDEIRALLRSVGLRGTPARIAVIQQLKASKSPQTHAELSERLKQLEAEGYQFEAADASLELLMREATGWHQDFFRLEGYRVTSYHRNAVRGGVPIENGESIVDTEASVKIWAGEDRLVAIGEGNGPVHALDAALRSVLTPRYPQIERIQLIDYRVRVLDSSVGTGAVVRILLDSTDGERTWSTVGVNENVIEASWQALTDSLVFGLLQS
jgi:hypothetical protein